MRMTKELPSPIYERCTMCHGRRWLPAAGPPGWAWCEFCGGTGTNAWYDDSHAMAQEREENSRIYWIIFCVMWWPVWFAGLIVAFHFSILAGKIVAAFWMVGIVQIFMSVHLFTTRKKTPWAQDGTAAVALLAGAAWLHHNNQKGR